MQNESETEFHRVYKVCFNSTTLKITTFVSGVWCCLLHCGWMLTVLETLIPQLLIQYLRTAAVNFTCESNSSRLKSWTTAGLLGSQQVHKLIWFNPNRNPANERLLISNVTTQLSLLPY